MTTKTTIQVPYLSARQRREIHAYVMKMAATSREEQRTESRSTIREPEKSNVPQAPGVPFSERAYLATRAVPVPTATVDGEQVRPDLPECRHAVAVERCSRPTIRSRSAAITSHALTLVDGELVVDEPDAEP